MIEALAILLACQLAGELCVLLTEIPLPGPVVGMVILLVGLLLRRRLTGRPLPVSLAATAHALLDNLSLLFVPAGVGVLLHLRLLEDEWLPISVALVVSTLLTIAVTGLTMIGLARLRRRLSNAGRGHE